MARIRLRNLMLVIAAIACFLTILQLYPVQSILVLVSIPPLIGLFLPLAPLLIVNHPSFKAAVLGRRPPTWKVWFIAWLLAAGLALLLVLLELALLTVLWA